MLKRSSLFFMLLLLAVEVTVLSSSSSLSSDMFFLHLSSSLLDKYGNFGFFGDVIESDGGLARFRADGNCIRFSSFSRTFALGNGSAQSVFDKYELDKESAQVATIVSLLKDRLDTYRRSRVSISAAARSLSRGTSCISLQYISPDRLSVARIVAETNGFDGGIFCSVDMAFYDCI